LNTQKLRNPCDRRDEIEDESQRRTSLCRPSIGSS
jgi:hypothetical protein